ncbi:N-acetylmuramoyl-L-alanine amidase [Microbulbifer sp. ZKSA006]|uniref:peptidoglycan recognition protein family protein n=2 Tax=unclassified Microbulbifer TaxID=2619833 RepID=UPI00403A2DC6
MLTIDKDGKVIDKRIKLKISLSIEKGPMSKVRGIIVHQTGGSTAKSTFNSYNSGKSGAHFLIDKDGTIYQTASLTRHTWHVGKLRSRCLAEMTCSPTELNLLKKFDPSGTHRREMAKNVPDRYPSNQDSIGIEIVGQALPVSEPDPDKRTYEALTKEQSDSLKWLIQELRLSLKVPLTEIFRHPTVSYKNKTEAATASW